MAFENGPFSESFLSAYCVVLLKRLPQSNDVNILFRFLIVGPVMGCLVFQCGRYLRRKLRLKTSHFCDCSRIWRCLSSEIFTQQRQCRLQMKALWKHFQYSETVFLFGRYFRRNWHPNMTIVVFSDNAVAEAK